MQKMHYKDEKNTYISHTIVRNVFDKIREQERTQIKNHDME